MNNLFALQNVSLSPQDKFGNVKQDLKGDSSHGGCVRKSWWIYPTKNPEKNPPKHTCQGQTIRAVCNFGTGDLPKLREEAVESRQDGQLTPYRELLQLLGDNSDW